MKKTTLKKCQEKLVSMKADIESSLSSRAKESLAIDPEVRDESDMAQEVSNKNLSLLLVDKDKKKLAQINKALEKIEDGSYGLCIDTEEPIEEKRLLANPLALRTIIAQEAFEKEQKERLLKRKTPISSMFTEED